MICPICGKEISSLFIYKDIEGNIAYEVKENGIEDRGINIYSEREVTCETPCCQSVLDIDEEDATALIKSEAVLVPFERLPEPFEFNGSQYFAVKYQGRLLIADYYLSHVEAYTWDDRSIGDFLLFQEADKLLKKLNTLIKRQLEKRAKEITEEDLVMNREEEKK